MNPCRDSAAIEGLLHRAPSGFEASRFGPSRNRRRAWGGSPVIQHVRKMADDSRPLSGTQSQIVVLGALEAFPHASKLQKELAPHHEQMTQIHVREQQFWRPRGLEL